MINVALATNKLIWNAFKLIEICVCWSTEMTTTTTTTTKNSNNTQNHVTKLLKQVKTENIKINAIIQNILILISDGVHISANAHFWVNC